VKSWEGQAIPTKLWTKEFVLIITSNLLMYLNFMMVTPVLPSYAADTFGDNKVIVGLVTSLFALSAILARMFSGVTLDIFGRKRMLMIGVFIFTITTTGYYLAGSVALFLFFRMAYGVGFGMAGTAYGTLAADVIPPKRMGEGMGYYGLASSISLASAPVIGIWLMGQYGFGALIFVSTILASFVFPTFLKMRMIEKTAPVRSQKREWFDKTSLLPCTLNVFLSITYGALIGFIALFGKEAGIKNIGLYFFFFSGMVLLVRFLSGKLYDRKGHIAVLPLGAILVALGLVLLSYSKGTFLLAIAGICYGAGFGMIQPALQAWTVQGVSPERRGAATAFFYNSLDFGLATGSFLLGIIASYSSYAIMYRLSALSMVFFLLIYGQIVLKEHKRSSKKFITEATMNKP
jgi:MFS family permease